jgi:hypothetical protein
VTWTPELETRHIAIIMDGLRALLAGPQGLELSADVAEITKRMDAGKPRPAPLEAVESEPDEAA